MPGTAVRWARYQRRQASPLAAPLGASLAGLPFLTDVFGPYARIIVEIAFGAIITADPNTWGWYDVTADVRQADGQRIVINPMGRSDETSKAQPAGCAFELDNTSGDYSKGRKSRWYPFVRRNTPVRVRLTTDGANWATVYQGQANGFVPYWDTSCNLAVVKVSASGKLRQLQQGKKQQNRNPLRSAAYREFAASNPTKYWALEELFLANSVAQQGTAVSAPTLQLRTSSSQPVVFAGVTPQAGCGPMPNFAAGGSLSFPLRGTDPNAWTVEFAFNFGAGEPSIDSYSSSHPEVNVFEVFNTTAPTGWTRWEFEVAPHNTTYPNGLLGLQRFDNGTSDFDFVVNENLPVDFNPWDGLNHHIGVRVVKNGGSVDWYLYVDGAQYRNGTLARAYTIADNAVVNGAPFISSQMPYGVGHVLFHDGAYTPPSSHGRAVQGWIGETATDRMIRLFREEGIQLDVTGSSDMAMGPQGVDTLVNLAGDCESADLGFLYDGRGPGCGYIARTAIYSLPAALTLDVAAGHVDDPFEPQDDDQRNHNLYTVTRRNGATVTAEDADGPQGTIAIGTYDGNAGGDLNLASDSPLQDIAEWLVGLGTVNEPYRYPNLNLDLAAVPAIAAAWLSLLPAVRIDVINVDSKATQHPAGTVSLLLEGYSQELSPVDWTVAANCSPYAPWRVAEVAADLGDTNEFLFRAAPDVGAMTVAGEYAAGFSGFITLNLLSAAPGNVFDGLLADDLPVDLDIAGWRVTMTNYNLSSGTPGAGGTQQIFVSALPGPLHVGNPVDLWDQPVIGL